jgi:hypothetical protein
VEHRIPRHGSFTLVLLRQIQFLGFAQGRQVSADGLSTASAFI